jgi:hypothetical protein
MPTLGNTPRPAYVYDTETDTWVPVGVGAHTHSDIPNTLVDAKGDLITATADNVPARLAKGADGTILFSDSSTLTGLKWAGAWADWTPTWTNLTVGNGTYNLRRFCQIGKIVFWKVDFTFGSTTSITGSDIRFSLPIAADLNGGMYNGSGFVLDAGTEVYDLQVEYTNADIYLRMRQTVAGGWVNGSRTITATSPFTWTTNDRFSINGWYGVA